MHDFSDRRADAHYLSLLYYSRNRGMAIAIAQAFVKVQSECLVWEVLYINETREYAGSSAASSALLEP